MENKCYAHWDSILMNRLLWQVFLKEINRAILCARFNEKTNNGVRILPLSFGRPLQWNEFFKLHSYLLLLLVSLWCLHNKYLHEPSNRRNLSIWHNLQIGPAKLYFVFWFWYFWSFHDSSIIKTNNVDRIIDFIKCVESLI